VKGSTLTDLTDVHSHIHALPQCQKLIHALNLTPHIHADTAGAAEEIAKRNDKTQGAIASSLAAEIYGLDILKRDVQDASHNTTRFLVLALTPPMMRKTDTNSQDIITSFYFEVRNIPASLYKAMGGFATNNVQMIKIESYLAENFKSARFYAEIYGHPDERNVGLALEELAFFAKDIKLMGSYCAHPFRSESN
jgi:prephenate dehydratase